MRVLLVSSHGEDPSAGGTEGLLAQLSTGLVSVGVEVAFLQAFPPQEKVGDFERTVLHRTDWRSNRGRRIKNHLRDVLAVPGPELKRAVARHRPDVVHTHNLPGISTAVWEACRRLGLPVAHSLHDYYLLCPRVTLMRRHGDACRSSPLLCGVRRDRLARWASGVSKVIGVSQFVLDTHAPLFPHAELHLIRHPTHSSSLPTGIRPPRSRLAVLGYIGSLDRIKGVDVLLQAAPRLARLGVGVRIAGDGRLRDAVAQSDGVTWEGALVGEQKRRFFEECDLGVIPSVWAEPGGPTFTMVEWLAAGRPVLVSTRGGLGEVAGVYPGSIPIEPGVDSILAAVTDLLESSHWEQTMGAVRPVESELDAEAWTGRHLDLYQAMTR